MEIISLNDASSGGGNKEIDNKNRFVITDLKQGVKNSNRVNVFLDSHFAFSLDVSQIVDYKLKVGKTVSSDEVVKFKKASEFGKLYQRALEKALTRPHSEKEIYDYLYKKVYEKGIDKKYINEIIERLENKKYVDDRKFAEFWVENRFTKKGVSQKRLNMELMKKGVAKEIIDEVLDKRDDGDEIEKIIANKRNKYDEEKLIQYLYRQGFSYELVKEKLAKMSEAD